MTNMTPETIKSERLRIGASQAKLAVMLGVTPQIVYLWEKGKRTPSLTAQILMRIIFSK